MAFASIANDGVLMRPRLIESLVEADGRISDPHPVREVRRVISKKSAATLRTMLKAVVDSGTASSIRRMDIAIAGKTGTAEKIDPETGKYLKGVFHSSFVGMAPAEHPHMVALVLIDEPQSLKYGGQSAAPVFREILDRMLLVPGNPMEAQVLAAKKNTSLPSAAMPNVVGLERPAAEELLALRGLQAKFIGVGKYVSVQEPMAGTLCSSGEIPMLQLGNSEEGRMPDLRQATLRDAVERLRDLGIEVEYEGEGRVLKQTPAAGEPLRPGSICRLQLGWLG
jgi:membrane peptidoglycan carboxypeptidase